MMNTSTFEIVDKGMNYLLEKLGPIGTEQFISVILREKFDYTKWRMQHFDDVSAEEFNSAAVEYAQSHPFKPNRKLIPINQVEE